MSKNSSTTLRQGDTSDIKYLSPFPNGNGGASDLTNTSYVCRTVVVAELGGTILIDKTITIFSADNMYFQVVLEPADTTLLTEGNYFWITEIENVSISPIFRKEHHIDLMVLPQGIS